jgi:hypothetical protein
VPSPSVHRVLLPAPLIGNGGTGSLEVLRVDGHFPGGRAALTPCAANGSDGHGGAVMLTGLLLTFAVTMLIWIALRRMSWLIRAGRAFLDGCAGAAQCWVPMESSGVAFGVDPHIDPHTGPRVDPDPEPPSDGATRVEAALVAQLYAGELTKAGYQKAMAALAAEDAIQHPMPNPPVR